MFDCKFLCPVNPIYHLKFVIFYMKTIGFGVTQYEKSLHCSPVLETQQINDILNVPLV